MIVIIKNESYIEKCSEFGNCMSTGVRNIEEECVFPWYLDCNLYKEKQTSEERGSILDELNKIEDKK